MGIDIFNVGCVIIGTQQRDPTCMRRFWIILIISLTLCANAFAKEKLNNNFHGISGTLLTNVQNTFKTKQEALQKLDTEKINTFYDEAPDEIKKALEPFGYFNIKIKSKIFRRGNVWYADYYITLNRPVKITSIDLKIFGNGAQNDLFQKIPHNLPMKVGDVLEVDKYEATKKLLFDTAGNLGYLNASLLKKEIRINLANYSAQITLYFDTGVRYYFGTAVFSKTPFSETFLRKFLNFKENEPYSSAKVDELRDTLSNSSFFQEVFITPEVSLDKSHTVPLKINLTPRKARQYSFGLGYGTDTGIRGLFGVEFRHLTKNGQSFKTLLRASERAADLEAHYLIPGKNPAKDLYDVSAAFSTLDQDYGRATTFTTAAAYITMLKKWQQTIKLSFLTEHYKINDDPWEHAALIMPGIGWLLNNADDLIHPTKGYSVNLNLQGSSEALGSTSSFVQSYLNVKFIQPFVADSQLVARGTLGYTAMNHLENLPLTLQYFAGGMQSIRGYSYNAIGPGRDLTVGSVELRHRVWDGWYGTVFLDAGNSTESFMPELKKSVGVGALYQSPIGLVQITFAKAVDEPGTPGKIQFSIGPEF